MVERLLRLCGMLSVIFGSIYVLFFPGTLPFSIGFSITETKGLAMFGLVGTVLTWGYRMAREKFAGRPTIQMKGGV